MNISLTIYRDNVFNYLWCYNQRKKSFKPDLYCFGYENKWQFNIWGCIQTQLNFTENSDLFKYGEWLNKDGDWRFDKERIRHALEKNIYHNRFCPAINLSLIEEVVAFFPEIVNPSKNKNWRFRENFGGQDGLLLKINKYGYDETVYMECVEPANISEIIKEIGKKMKNKLPEKVF